jgi:zinc protease
MLIRGTETRSADEIGRTFDRMGGTLSAVSGNNSLYLSAACLTDDFPKAMEIVADCLRNPAFRPEVIERLRPLLIAAARRQRDDWHEELMRAFRRNFFKNGPYRLNAAGTPEELRGITHEDLVAFHRATCAPINTVLAVFGDINPEQVRVIVQQLLATWGGSAALKLPPLTPEAPLNEDRTVQETSAVKVGGVFIGYPGMTLADDRDRYAMDVFDALLSGIHLPRGWLHETLRGKGLVYEVAAYNFAGIEPGYFGLYAGCEPGKVEEVRKLMLEQATRVFREKISESDLESARRICLTADVLERQTNAQQATRCALDELYGLGYDNYKKYGPGIAAVNDEELRRVAKKYLTRYVCVLMTPAP